MWNNFNVRRQQKLHMLCQYLLPVHLKESYILWPNPKHEWPMDNCWASVYHPRPIWKSSNNFCSVPSSSPGSGACPALAPQSVTPDPCLPLWAYSIHPRPPCLPAPIQCTYMDIVFRCASISSTYPSELVGCLCLCLLCISGWSLFLLLALSFSWPGLVFTSLITSINCLKGHKYLGSFCSLSVPDNEHLVSCSGQLKTYSYWWKCSWRKSTEILLGRFDLWETKNIVSDIRVFTATSMALPEIDWTQTSEKVRLLNKPPILKSYWKLHTLLRKFSDE